MKEYIIVTGGAGFIGSNLIEYLIKKTNKKIISIDNYSSGSKKNHIPNPRIKYFKGDTKNISSLLKNYKRNSAIKTKTEITATVPHKTNFVKLFQVFLWFSLSINLLLSCFKLRICLIDYVNSTSSSY